MKIIGEWSRVGLLASILSIGIPGSTVLAQPTAAQGASKPVAPLRLGVTERREIVENVAVAAANQYVDAAAGARIAAQVRERLRAGRYERYADPFELAAALTADIRAAVSDVHLRVVYEPNRAASTIVQRGVGAPGAGQNPGPRSFGRIDGRSDAQIARTNFGFEAAQRLDGNVGYLKISRFVPLDLSSKSAAAAMDFLAHSDAMIIDLRGNIGGSPDLVQQLLSYFAAAEPRQLFASFNRQANATTRMMSLATVPGQRLTGRPLYVLIDRQSASSAEMFAYIVQRAKLGTVIGETSSGAGNGGNMVPVGSGLSFFVPHSRVVDGPGWEQVGVKPDRAVDPSVALESAHRLALEALVAQPSDPALKREREWALEMVEAAGPGVADAAVLADYDGTYGTRSFRVEGGRLLVVPAAGQPVELTRISRDIFRTAASRYTFERNASGAVTSVRVETASGTETRAERSGR